MTIFMYNTVCVTNRHLVKGDFIQQIEKILDMNPEAIVLREKDMSEEEFEKLAKKVLRLCKEKNVPCYFNSFVNVALRLKPDGVQVPFDDFCLMIPDDKEMLGRVGVSVHSMEEAEIAEKRGADFLVYGHIFATDCKKGLEPRGTEALKKICRNAGVPVFAIGGINDDNARECFDAGAACVCRMSSLMKI